MSSTLTRGKPILPLDPKLNNTHHRMNIQKNPAYVDKEINRQFPPPNDAHNRVVSDNPTENNLRRQPPTPRPQDYYRINFNITDTDGPLALHPSPPGHTLVIVSRLM